MNLFDWLDDLLNKGKTSSLEKHYEKQAYQKQVLEEAEEKGKVRAKTEAKQEKEQVKQGKKVKYGFDKFQDFATNFADNQAKQKPMFGDLNFSMQSPKKSRRRI